MIKTFDVYVKLGRHWSSKKLDLWETKEERHRLY